MASKADRKEQEAQLELSLNAGAIPLARAKKAMAIWLAFTDEESAEQDADRGTNEAKNKDEPDGKLGFVPRNNRATVGAIHTEDEYALSQASRSGLSKEIEQLRIQVLGKKAASRLAAASASKSKDSSSKYGSRSDYNNNAREGLQANGEKRKVDQTDDEDEEMSRASAIKSKRQKQQPIATHVSSQRLANRSHGAAEKEEEEERDGGKDPDSAVESKAKNEKAIGKTSEKESVPPLDNLRNRRPYSYLDEVLQSKSNKKKKKRKKSTDVTSQPLAE